MDCSRRRTLELGLGAVGSLTLLAGCSDSGPGGENETNESDGGENASDSEGNASEDEQADHPDEVGEDMEEEGEPTGYAPDANESEENDTGNGTAGPEQDG